MNEETIFAAALEKPLGAQREAFLNEACAGNPALRAQIEELLRADANAGSFLEHPPADLDATIVREEDEDTVNSGAEPVSLAFLEPSDKPNRIGLLGVYEIIEVVGQGGMGAVLRAFDSKLNRIVAVKVMSPELAANPTAVKRLREARTAAAVVHDHVVNIHAVDDAHRPPYLVMEFVEGQTLQQKIDREGALDVKQILRIGSQMAAGLAAAHKVGLIHRDVKPGNILLENGVERVKITDFGLARAADDLEMTKTGLIAGTPQYMSPEQAQGESIDTRSDLFALGSVLYAMCTGRAAFRAETTMGVLRRVCDDAPRPIREVNVEIPDWLEAIVLKLLAKKPDERFQTANEVAELLSAHLAHEQQPGVAPRPQPIVHPAKPLADQGARKPRSRGRKRVLMVVGLSVLAAVLVWRFGPPLVLTASNQGQVTFTTDDTHAEILLTREGRTLALRAFPDRNRTLRLTPGTYGVQIQPRLGRSVESVSYLHQTMLTGHYQPRFSHPVEIYVGRGDRVQLTAVFRDTELDAMAIIRGYSGSLYQDEPLVGKTLCFEVTGEGSGAVWGSDVYTTDSSLRTAAVHAGALKHGETGFVNVTMLPGQDRYTGSSRHRVTSSNWTAFPASYSVERVGNVVPVDSPSGPRNPFGVVDVPNPDGVDVQAFLPYVDLEAGDDDDNAALWTDIVATTERGSIDGQWAGRWYGGDVGPMWVAGSTTIKTVGDRVYILHKETDCTFLIDARRVESDRLIGRYITLDDPSDSSPWVGKIVSPERIDGQWTQGRWDFRRKVEIRPPGVPPAAIAPFDEKQAQAHQEAWSKHLGVQVEKTNSVGMKLRLIPPGEFEMGSSAEDIERFTKGLAAENSYWATFVACEGPRQKVIVSKPFYMGSHEVTRGQFRKFVEAMGYKTHAQSGGKGVTHWSTSESRELQNPEWTWEKLPFDQDDDHPVVGITWQDAQAFCQWLSREEDRPYVLPTEAQWEFACRAGNAGAWCFGDDISLLEDYCSINFHGTQPVGSKRANAFGLFDVHRNAHEYCLDSWIPHRAQPDRETAKALQADPDRCVIRGGCWVTSYEMSRCAYRRPESRQAPSSGHGFRVALVGNLP